MIARDRSSLNTLARGPRPLAAVAGSRGFKFHRARLAQACDPATLEWGSHGHAGHWHARSPGRHGDTS
eukprot:2791569-Rhodomonas_salina.2